jgi:hypothetical protein
LIRQAVIAIAGQEHGTIEINPLSVTGKEAGGRD